MIFISIAMVFMLSVSLLAHVHALGLWLMLLITHGIFVNYLGDIAIHLPLYSGIMLTLIILVRNHWSGVDAVTLGLFLSLGLVMAVGSIAGLNPDASVSALILYAKAFILALLVAGCVKEEAHIHTMMLYCLTGLVIGALYTIVQYQTDSFTINTLYSKRAAGLRGDPNETAMLLVAGIPFALYWYAQSKRAFMKIIFASCIPLLLIGIGLTGSRGGFVTVLVVVCVVYVRRPTIQKTVIGLLLGAVALTFAPTSYWERMQTLVYGEAKQSVSLKGRSQLLREGIALFFDYPVLGVGPGNFGTALISDTALSKKQISHGGNRDTPIVAHNLYLEFFVENGVIGGSILLIILYLAITRLLHYDRTIETSPTAYPLGFSLSLALGALLFASLFLSQGKNSVLWFLVGLAFASGQLGKKQQTYAEGLSAHLELESQTKHL